MSDKRANMLIKAIVEIEQACNNKNETHSEIWQIAYNAIRENARMVAEMHYTSEPSNEFDKKYRENRINALEKLLTEQLRIAQCLIKQRNFIAFMVYEPLL